MSTPTYDLLTRHGNTLTVPLRFKSADGSPFDLTGSELVFYCKAQQGSVNLRKTIGSGLAMSDPASGRVTVTLTAAETRSLPAGRMTDYEIERRIDGTEKTLLAGLIEVEAGINDDAA